MKDVTLFKAFKGIVITFDEDDQSRNAIDNIDRERLEKRTCEQYD